MARDLTTVAAGVPFGGGVSYAPLGTTLPTDATTALDVAFKPLGPISAEGIRPATETNVEKPKEWDGSTLANLLTDESRSFEITFLGMFEKNLQEFRAGTANVTAGATAGDPKLSVLDKGGKPAACVLVLEMKFQDKPIRYVLGNADPVITGEEPIVSGALMGLTMSVEALKDSSGVRVYEYYDTVAD